MDEATDLRSALRYAQGFDVAGWPGHLRDEEVTDRHEEALQRLLEQAAAGRALLAKFEYLPYGATVARRVVDGEWITDFPVAEECNQTSFICPVCTWPQEGHPGPGRYKGNAENTHEEGCSLRAVLDGKPAPRLARAVARIVG